MDKISKFLRLLNPREKKKLENIQQKIKNQDWENLDIRPIKSRPNFFRVRVDRFRLIFSGKKAEEICLHKITKRNKNTY